MEPPKKKRRESEGLKISRSCDSCRLKKVKCDALKPVCSFCLKNENKECNFSIMKQPGLKAGYGRSMKQRMDCLESELSMLKAEMVHLRNKVDPHPTNDYNSTLLESRSIQIPTLLNPQAEVDIGDSGLPPVSLCILLIELFFLNVIPIFPLLHSSLGKDLEKSLNSHIEPPLILYAIVLITIKFLNEDQMSKDLQKIYYARCKDKIIATALHKINLESLQAMVLLAYDSLGGSVKVPEGWNYVSIAADYANYLKLGRENKMSTVSDSPTSVISSEGIGNRTPNYIRSKSINLLEKPKSWIDEESRRHCFWCVFILDKFFAICSSHEMKLKSERIGCFLPLKLTYWYKGTLDTGVHQQMTLKDIGVAKDEPEPEIYDAFGYYIQVNKIIGDIHTFLIEDFNMSDDQEIGNYRMKFNVLENEITSWVNSLPQRYRVFLEAGEFNFPLEPYDVLLHLFYHLTVLKLHSTAAYPFGETDNFKASQDSKNVCMDSVAKVYEFVSKLPTLLEDPEIFTKFGPHFGFCIWVFSRILFVHIIYHQVDNLSHYQRILGEFSEILYKLGSIWESSMVYFKILQFLNINDLSYVHNSPAANDDPIEEDEDGVGEHRDPKKVFSDMRKGSHALLYWFNKLSKKERPADLTVFHTESIQGFEELQLTHDDFFNFLALDVNESGIFQDMR